MENLSKWAFYENNRDFNGIKVDLSKKTHQNHDSSGNRVGGDEQTKIQSWSIAHLEDGFGFILEECDESGKKRWKFPSLKEDGEFPAIKRNM